MFPHQFRDNAPTKLAFPKGERKAVRVPTEVWYDWKNGNVTDKYLKETFGGDDE